MDGENETSITIAIVWRTINTFESFYTSNILTSLENIDTFSPPSDFDFQSHNKGKKETTPEKLFDESLC